MYSLETKLDNLEIKLDKIVDILDQLIQQNIKDSEKLNTNLNCINRSTQNMDHHINFVENVFDVVKYPFSSLLRLYYGNKTGEIKDILDIPLPKTSKKTNIKNIPCRTDEGTLPFNTPYVGKGTLPFNTPYVGKGTLPFNTPYVGKGTKID
jgi:hypothetical protein